VSAPPPELRLESPDADREFASALHVAGTAGEGVTHVEVRFGPVLAAVLRPQDGRFARTLATDDLHAGAHVLAVTAYEEQTVRARVERRVRCRRPRALSREPAPALRTIAFHARLTPADWTAVARARPRFLGHAQPHVPADLGFTDPSSSAARDAQARLAAAYGIDAFCYAHDPRTSSPGEVAEIAYCLCYRGDADVPPREVRALFGDALKRFADPRYVRVEGRPLYLVRRPELIPCARETFAAWRAACAAAGEADPFLLLVQRAPDDDPAAYALDGAVELPPLGLRPAPLSPHVEGPPGAPRVERYDFEELRDLARRRERPPYPLFRGVMPGWDDTPRRAGTASAFVNDAPEGYRAWLAEACAWTAAAHPPERQLVFAGAWNDWTRGAHLEPGVRWGRLHLEATRDVLTAQRSGRRKPVRAPLVSVVVPCHDHERFVARAIASVLDQTLDDLELIVVDDGSRDESVAAVHELLRERGDSRARVFAQRNLGAHAALNAGLARARGRFVAFLNSDDRFAVDRLQIMTAALDERAADFAFSEVAYEDALGRDVTFEGGEPLRYLLKQAEIASYPELVYALLDFNVTISSGNVVMRRSLAERIGGFAPLLYCHDWDFALRAVRAGEAVYVDRALYHYRFHGENAHGAYAPLAAYEGRIVMETFFADAAFAAALCARDPAYYRRFVEAHALEPARA
jgi:glycosyltransferase involved in cell wall biosynthesis